MYEKEIKNIEDFSCLGDNNFELVQRKYNMITELLNQIEHNGVKGGNHKALKKLLTIISIFGYEAGLNRAKEVSGTELFSVLISRLLNVAKPNFAKNKPELVPFYKMHIKYILQEPQRSNLKKELEQVRSI